MKSILKVAYEKAKQIVKENIETIEKLASILLEKEYLSKEEFENIMKNPSIVDQMIEENKAKNIQKAIDDEAANKSKLEEKNETPTEDAPKTETKKAL